MLNNLRTQIKANEEKLHISSYILFSSAESSVGFGRREKGTKHAAKLQLVVLAKSRTHFVEVCLQGFS